MSNRQDQTAQVREAFERMRADMEPRQPTLSELAANKSGPSIEAELYRRRQSAELDRMRAELELGAARLAFLADPSGGAYPQWRVSLDEREREQLAVCESYARNYSKAGLPGHNIFMFVAKLSKLLDEAGQ